MNEKVDNLINDIVHSIYSIKGIMKGKIMFYAIYEEDSLAYALFSRMDPKDKIVSHNVNSAIVDNCFELNSVMSRESMDWYLFVLKIENLKFNVEFKYLNNKILSINEKVLRNELLESYFGDSLVKYL
ncbi:hypothetical protein [Leptospira levettii]|uniref:hypothetical protein n=1 Tax=Leptospira levettii TaxID=2023178 RepID=UPI003EBEEE78